MINEKSINLRILLDHRDPITIKVDLVKEGDSGSLNPWNFSLGSFRVESRWFADFLLGIMSNGKFEARNLLGIKKEEVVIGVYCSE